MYSAVPPPEHSTSEIERNGEREKERPLQGISEETWKKFQQLRERRIKCSKASTDKRVKEIKKKVNKSVLNNFRSDEEIAVLRDQGVVHRTSKKWKQDNVSDQHDNKNEVMKNSEERWSELQCYFSPQSSAINTSGEDTCTSKDLIEKRLDTAVKEKKFDVAVELNKQLVQCDFAVKVAQAVECRDYVKRKTAEQEKAKKKKKAKPYWAFEQKHRWESKGNM